MTAPMTPRSTDRWVTPAVVIWALILGSLIVMFIVGTTAYLTARGFDPAPVVSLVGTLTAAVGAVINLGINLSARRGVAKVERNTGRLPHLEVAVLDTLDTVTDPGRHAYAPGDTAHLPPVPPVPVRGAAPVVEGR